MKDLLLKDWNFLRVFRLLTGLGITIYAIVYNDYIFLVLSVMFLFQAIFNISCGPRGCSTPYKNQTDFTKDFKNLGDTLNNSGNAIKSEKI